MIDSAMVVQLRSTPASAPRPRPSMLHSGYGRSVHFLDIENLCGTADISRCDASRTMRAYRRSVRVAPGDHVIIGASHHNLLNAGVEWPEARVLPPRSGLDGADEAIREALHTERITERFDTVILGTGDGGFAPDVARLAGRGARVHIVSRPGALSPKLRLAAHTVTFLSDNLFSKDNIA
ncbi:NYN domain-containing protein [Rhodococcus hoagii]|nr:NYN domain-containing protein [Prescottella equi]NKS99578.1 NYN domain-containing protein [Prescottella equi]